MLRCELFPTIDREVTQYIAIRDTLTRNDPTINAYDIDAVHCRQGRVGIGYHFLILSNGDIQLCRRLHSVGSHSKYLDGQSVAVGIVGGVGDTEEAEGLRMDTRSPEQLSALRDLTIILQNLFPEAEVHDRPQQPYQ